jgi:hypothetical protein
LSLPEDVLSREISSPAMQKPTHLRLGDTIIPDHRAAHKAARHDAKLATLTARWDPRREAVYPLHADAAIDVIPSPHAFSTTTALCNLTL